MLWNQLNPHFWESGCEKCCYHLIISINSSTNRPPLLTTCIVTSCYNICAPFNRKWVRALNCRSILIRPGQIFWSGPTYCSIKNCSFGSTHWAFNSTSEDYLFIFIFFFCSLRTSSASQKKYSYNQLQSTRLSPLCARGVLLGETWSVALVTKRGGRRSGSEAPHNNKLNTYIVHKKPRRTPAVASLRHFQEKICAERWSVKPAAWIRADCSLGGSEARARWRRTLHTFLELKMDCTVSHCLSSELLRVEWEWLSWWFGCEWYECNNGNPVSQKWCVHFSGIYILKNTRFWC